MKTALSNQRVTIDFPSDLYRTLRTFAAFHDLSIKDFVIGAVNHELEKNNVKVPNSATLKTFKKTDAGKELHKYNSFNALLTDLKKKKKIK